MIAKEESLPVMVFKRMLHKPAPLPLSVQVDLTNRCNLSCTMCPIHYLDIEKTHIDFELLKKIIDNLSGGVKEVALVGLGEPLTHPRLIDAIKYCKSRGKVTKITTNGLLLDNDDRIRELILSGLDSISFSIESISQHGPDKVAHRDNRVARNIERLMELKKELKTDLPCIGIQTILFKHRENDVYEIVKWSAAHNVFRVNVLRMHLYFDIDAKRPDAGEEKKIFREFAKLRKKYNVRIDCLQDQFYSGLKGMLYKYFKYLLGLDSFCIRLLDFPVISQAGDMIPCCVLPNYKFGNILEEKLEDVWRGEKINNFRKNHNKVERCTKCDCWRIKQVI